ncbi:MAG: RagB/SusD family nutrient uptake outer membrane protein [Prolixibacteraceae bacterium]|jgi:hypothetical protein|nr:RagB/SusD family nutrient uptake outer membrane protein [Prolixibacteraceae bacterium]
MKKYISFLIITFMFIFESCHESFLNQEYKNGLVDVNFWKTPEHAKSAVTGVYDVLGFEGQYLISRKAMGSSAADDQVELHGDYSRVGAGLIELDLYQWHSASRYIMDHWYSSYKGIGRANEVIKNVPKITSLNADLSKRYVAEAKALRALFYFNLVTAFVNVPLIVEPITLEQTKVLTNSTQAEVWKQIIADLTEASTILPVTYPAADLGRVTRGFVYGLLSTVYLWTKEYDKSIAAANNVTGYSLWPNYADIFNGVKESSNESILEIMNASGSPSEDIWHTENSEVNRSLLYGPFYSWSMFMAPSRSFIDKEFESGDIRKRDMILDLRKGDKFDVNGDGVIDSKDASIMPTNPPGDAFCLKYVKKGVNLTSGAEWSGGVQTVNVIIMRYSEILLNLAEAYNESGQSANALLPLNMVRARAGLAPVTSTNKTTLQAAILHERAVEFCFEGFRFFDLKRAGRLTEVLGSLGFNAGKNELFPIPQTEIDLTKLKQNPGY